MATIMPCFVPLQAEAEGKIIGRLLAGYGELELLLCNCIAETTGDLDAAVKCFFRVRGGEKRIAIASTMVGDLYRAARLGKIFKAAIKDIDQCRKIRNQYAHCHWGYGHPGVKLWFVNLEETARKAKR